MAQPDGRKVRRTAVKSSSTARLPTLAEFAQDTATGVVRISGQSTASVSPAVGEWLAHVEEIGRVACDAVAEGLGTVGRDTVVALGSPPLGALTEEGSYQFVWDHGRHHLLAEILPAGRYDWFYRDRETGRLDGEEDLPFVETAKLRRRLERNLGSRGG